MKDYFADENVEYENEIVVKKTIITKASHYLVLGLKRNVYPTKEAALQGKLEKIEKEVSFPLDLNISNYVQGNRAPLYRLKAFVVHAGSAGGGHYWSYVRKGNVWYECNDRDVSPISLARIQEIANKGYVDRPNEASVLFFYEAQ